MTKNHLQPLKFQGQFYDIETRLHYNRFRYYDSDVGMFIQKDPIGLLGGVNVFAYVPNPVGWVDPFGLCADPTPDWREDMFKGIAFNNNRKGVYEYNELYILKPNADKLKGNNEYYRLDSYDTRTGEIVSKKHTQFADINESTAKSYLSELSKKYPENATIADVPSSGGLAGKTLKGKQILEVPIQNKPISQSILDYANDLKIDIRQVITKKP